MGRTALGTQKAANATSLTLTNVAVAVGETIIVAVGVSGASGASPTGVTWNGQALTLADASDQANVSTIAAIYYKKITTGGGTGSVVASFDIADDVALFALKHDTLADSPFDKGAANDDTTTTAADSGNTATTAQADEFLVGAICTSGPTTDGVPTWLNSFTAGQRDGNFGGNNVTLNEGYHTVSSAAAYKAAATLATARDWASVIATFKITAATPQTSTPSSIDVPVTANDATPIVGARVVVPDSLAVPVTPAVAAAQGGQLEIEHGPRLPEAVTVQNFVVVRPTTPPELGDEDAATGVTVSYAPVVNPLNPAGGSIEVLASAIADVPLPPGQVISHLRFRALAYSFEDQTSAPGLTNYRMGWKVGANTAEAAVTNEDPGWGNPNPVRRDADGLDVGDATPADYYVTTGSITTKPGGGAWTPADVNALEDVALRLTYAAGTEFLDLTVAEFLIEVHGPIGGPAREIRIPQNMGRLVRAQKLNTTTGGE